MADLELISEGTSIRTYLLHDNGTTYIKKILAGANSSVSDFHSIEVEVRALQNLHHPCIPELLNYSLDEEISLSYSLFQIA